MGKGNTDSVEREMVLVIFESAKHGAEVERVIVYKDRETALDAFFGEYKGRSVLTMAEINREVKQAQPSVIQESLPGLDDGEDTIITRPTPICDKCGGAMVAIEAVEDEGPDGDALEMWQCAACGRIEMGNYAELFFGE